MQKTSVKLGRVNHNNNCHCYNNNNDFCKNVNKFLQIKGKKSELKRTYLYNLKAFIFAYCANIMPEGFELLHSKQCISSSISKNRLLEVTRSIRQRLVGLSVCNNFLKGREVSLPCSHRC